MDAKLGGYISLSSSTITATVCKKNFQKCNTLRPNSHTYEQVLEVKNTVYPVPLALGFLLPVLQHSPVHHLFALLSQVLEPVCEQNTN